MTQTKARLLVRGLILLAPPALFVVWLVSGAGVRWIAAQSRDFRGSLFSANTGVMTLVWLGYLMTLTNLCFYISHVYKHAFGRGAADSGGRRDLLFVFGCSVLIAMAIAIFLCVTVLASWGVDIPHVSFDRVVLYNHYFLLVIFVSFALMDWRAANSAKRRGATADVSAARMTIWLVSVPCILATCFALLLHQVLMNNADWMLMFDKPEILSADRYGYLHVPLVNPTAQEKPFFGLFVSGLNIGILMASIVASQIAFFVIQVFREGGFSVTGEGAGREEPAAGAGSGKGD